MKPKWSVYVSILTGSKTFFFKEFVTLCGIFLGIDLKAKSVWKPVEWGKNLSSTERILYSDLVWHRKCPIISILKCAKNRAKNQFCGFCDMSCGDDDWIHCSQTPKVESQKCGSGYIPCQERIMPHRDRNLLVKFSTPIFHNKKTQVRKTQISWPSFCESENQRYLWNPHTQGFKMTYRPGRYSTWLSWNQAFH